MAVIKVTDLAYARLQSPSLDEAEEFLTAFGLVRSERTRETLYMRGTDPSHHIHITHRGPSRFVGLGFFAASEDDLKTLARVSRLLRSKEFREKLLTAEGGAEAYAMLVKEEGERR